MTAELVPYWISWWADPDNGEWELHSPWWISGARLTAVAPITVVPGPESLDYDQITETSSIVAAVLASSEQHAKDIVCAAHDSITKPIEWRFCEEKEHGWEPFCERFPRADWMEWN